MNRRELLLGAASLVAAATASSAFAADESMHEHHHPEAGNQALTNAISDCIQHGQVCLNHCIDLMGKGEKEMADCAKNVNQMLAICTAFQQLVNQSSKYQPAMAKLAMDACHDCEEICKKHAEKHEVCKACMDSCAACVKECKKVAS
jgi:Cys-rich four helix bundle protein (predicted Tat secretion target)